jgi:hypothetical protein
MTITSLEFKQANARAKALKTSTPAATSAYFDRKSGNIIVTLSSGVGIFFSPKDAQGLERAKPSQLEPIDISPSGYGIHFPKLDADLYLPSILEGFLGSRKWMAARLGSSRWLLPKQAQSGSRSGQRLPRRPPQKTRREIRYRIQHSCVSSSACPSHRS